MSGHYGQWDQRDLLTRDQFWMWDKAGEVLHIGTVGSPDRACGIAGDGSVVSESWPQPYEPWGNACDPCRASARRRSEATFRLWYPDEEATA